MTRRHLTIFVEACHCQSFSKAAEHLNTTQPAVSLAIRELEAHYGVKLFERMNRRIYLTQAGRALLAQAEEILRGFQEAEDLLGKGNAPYLLRVGANVTFGSTSLSPLLRQFRQEYPEVTLRVWVGNSQDIEKKLLENQLDVGIVDNVAASQHLKAFPLYVEQMCLLCSPGFSPSPSSLEELASLPLLLREPGSGMRRGVDRVFQARGLSPQPLMESTSTTALIRAAEAGLGILILPEAMAQPFLHQGTLRQLTVFGASFPRQYYAALHRQKTSSPPLKGFLTLLREGEPHQKDSGLSHP